MSDRKVSDDFEGRAKRLFDRSAAELDAATRSRLTQARYRALQELAKGRPRFEWRRTLVPAGVAATAAFAAWLAFVPARAPEPALQTTALDDLEILLGEEDLGMLDEDVEFYAWLEDQPEFAEPAAAGDDGVG